ncbi:unnamed protein product [Thlaspi arvense]|uniref:phosphoglucomutase (alpha-D-glucose-1,6-bisphosphate-dependent) n=1 Tax=Thlaspi arvense TaxID=13288 RepID=A0AAU9RT15_THLAR|nr:unnamed protein product [Thlaspi arvense]
MYVGRCLDNCKRWKRVGRLLHMGRSRQARCRHIGSLHLNPDGMFPNHIPNPEDKTAMSLTRSAVLNNSADLGIVFDTDVDRSGVVDNLGNPINGDRLIALMSAIVLKEHPGTTIVTDARTSMALTQFITDRGGHHCLYRVGYRNVIDQGSAAIRMGSRLIS